MKRLPIIKRLKEIDQLGVIYGIVSSLIGSVLFGASDTLQLFIRIKELEVLSWIGIALYAFIFTVIPSAVFGLFLARKIKKDINMGKTSAFYPTLRGFLVGLTFAILFSIGIFAIFSYGIRAHGWGIFDEFFFSALIITPIVCGWASYHLHQRLRNEVEG